MMPWRHRPTVWTGAKSPRAHSLPVPWRTNSSQVKLKSWCLEGALAGKVGKGTCSLCTLSVRSCSQPPTPFRLIALKNTSRSNHNARTPQRTTPHATPLRQWSPCGPNARLAHARRMAIMAMPPASRMAHSVQAIMSTRRSLEDSYDATSPRRDRRPGARGRGQPVTTRRRRAGSTGRAGNAIQIVRSEDMRFAGNTRGRSASYGNGVIFYI